MRFTHAIVAIAISVSAFHAPVHAQGETIHKQLTEEQSEDLLKKSGIEFKKLESKTPGTSIYDYKRKGFNVRFYLYDGKDLMLDAVFARLPIDKVNEWNKKAKFSRAVFQKDAKAEFVTLESNLDLIGGVTEGAFRQYISNFDEELKLFARYLGNAANDDRVYPVVAADRLEGALKSVGIVFEKAAGKNGEVVYDYEFEGRKLRLVNFAGKDLMIDAHFKKIALDDINRYNLEKKFIRAVYYNIKGMEHTALECNLDCEVGSSDGILRSFILGFHEDVKNFAKYVDSK